MSVATKPDVGAYALDAEQFLRMSMDLCSVTSADGYFLWLNASWSRTLGWSEAELRSRPLMEFVHPDDRASTAALLAHSQPGEAVEQFRNRYSCKSGAWRWLEWNAIKRADGTWYCITRDVTESQASATELRRREELLRMASEVSRTGHWLIDLPRDRVIWSDQVYRIHGRDPKNYTPDLNKGIEAYHPDDREHVQECVQRAIEHRTPFEFECRLMRPDGTERLVQSIGRPDVDPATDEVTGVFGVFRDITDDDRSRRYQELEQFAYVAAHDLRQPAGTVQSFVTLLLKSVDEPTEQQQLFARYIQQAASRLTQLITDLKSYAESGARVDLAPVNCQEVVDAVLVDTRPLVEVDGGEVRVEDLPDVVANDALLRQVFQNLLTNAARFRSADRPLRVHIYAKACDDRVGIFVEDNGMGFDNAHAKYIFEPFRRLNTRREGSGIGLSIARRMIHQCGGELWTRGEEGVGALFWVDLPLARD